MSWPGREADDWWDGLNAGRRMQVYRWMTQRRDPHADMPEHQLDMTELFEESYGPDPR